MKVILSRRAAGDLRDVIDSLSNLNPAAAEHLGERFIFRFQMLEQNPRLGESCRQYGRSLRRTTVEKYVMYYRIQSMHVEVLRIIHGYRDHGPLLEDLD